jgi:H+-transporting ATPase
MRTRTVKTGDLISTEDAKKIGINELLNKLSASKEGLSDSEATKRLEQYGPNEIPEKKVNPLAKFLSYFWGPIPLMIEAAVVMSAIIRSWEDFAIILVLLLSNAVIGFTRERQAGNAIELLKQKLALKARVLRDNKWQEKPARELVPGDIVRIRLGDIIPADVKLIEGSYLLADESALTGESLPVEKHVPDVAYAGSIARQGEMNGLVATTGAETYFGKTTKLVEEAKTKSHFQKAVVRIGDYLIFLAIALVAVIIAVGLLRNEKPLQILQFALVLMVAAIPAALPTVLSVTMAIGAIALAAKEAIVSKLVAIEEMAGMDILCTDKTGTITKNELTVGEVKPLGKFTDNDVLLYSALASREEDKDPIDTAIIAKAESITALAEPLRQYRISDFKPFDPVSKRTEATLQKSNGAHFRISKGAPQVILSLAANKEKISGTVEEIVNSLAAKGYRSLGVAKTDAQDKWQFTGLIALYDPPREDSADTIKIAKSMGVNVKMVTGDHIAIAKETARRVNLGTDFEVASSLLNKPESEAVQVVEKADGFAEVFPENKYHIVELLQSRNHIVGMTGDGVNDAPALKKADAGIAVAGATDAAKSAAAIVLTKPGLSVIIDAIQQSRKIFQRMTNYAIYRIAETIRVLLFITASILAFNIYPVTALMIVLLAILNDLPVITIAYDNVKYSDFPEKWDMRKVLGIATFLGLIGVFSSFGLLLIGIDVLHIGLTNPVLQSFIYLKLSVAGHTVLFAARTRDHFWTIRPAKILLFAVITTQLIATLLTVYGILLPAMGWGLAAIVWGYALTLFVITDFLKVQFYKRLSPTDGGPADRKQHTH